MKKGVIYSSLIGSYDKVRQPLIVDERFDYLLFTDDVTSDRIGVWEIRPIPFMDGNNMLRSRFVKCHPAKVLADYEASLYIDANLQIASQHVYDRFIELLEDRTEWAGIQHPSQKCVYDEICAIVDLKWVHDYDVVNWYGKMKRDGFPEDWGLFENNVIFRRHTSDVERVGDFWWETLQTECKRDQFSLMYALWKNQLSGGLFLPKGECPRLNSEDFVYYEHNPHKRVLNMGILERFRRSLLRASAISIRSGYRDLFNKLSKYKYPKFALYFWELSALFRYGPKSLCRALKARRKS